MAEFSVEPQKFEAMFDYHSAPERANEDADGGIVFGRKDTLVADAAGELLTAQTLPWVVITGGVGKDSGDLQVPEAEYLGNHLKSRGISDGRIYIEPNATNGGENVRFSFALIQERMLPHVDLTAIAHATSLRRLAAMMTTEASNDPNFRLIAVNRAPSAHPFDGENPADQREAVDELLRLADWPNKTNADGSPWLLPQPELERPELIDLVAYARDAKVHFSQQ